MGRLGGLIVCACLVVLMVSSTPHGYRGPDGQLYDAHGKRVGTAPKKKPATTLLAQSPSHSHKNGPPKTKPAAALLAQSPSHSHKNNPRKGDGVATASRPAQMGRTGRTADAVLRAYAADKGSSVHGDVRARAGVTVHLDTAPPSSTTSNTAELPPPAPSAPSALAQQQQQQQPASPTTGSSTPPLTLPSAPASPSPPEADTTGPTTPTPTENTNATGPTTPTATEGSAAVHTPDTHGGLQPGITVCVPCIPRDLEVLRTDLLPSVANQTLLPNEVIIALSETSLNDGREIQTALGSKFPSLRIRVLPCEDKKAPGMNRNRAATAARTQVVSFMDADDLMHPDRLSVIEDVMARYHPACIIHSFSTTRDVFNEKLHAEGKVSPLHFGAPRLDRYQELAMRAGHFVMAAEGGVEAYPMEHHGHVSCAHYVTDQIKYDDAKQAEDTHFTAAAHERFNNTVFVGLPLSVYRPSWSFPEVKVAVGAYSYVEDFMRKHGAHAE